MSKTTGRNTLKTLNGESLYGPGDIVIPGGTGSYIDATGGDYTAVAGQFIEYKSGSNTVTFPDPTSVSGLRIKVTNTGSGTITLDGDGVNVAGSPTFDIYQDETLELFSNGIDWVI